MATEIVAVKEHDYLDEDKPIRGQNYVCMSFLNPEDVVKNKEVYFFEQFLDQFAKDVKQLFDSMKDKYPDSAEAIGVVAENYDYIVDSSKLHEQYKFYKTVHSADMERDYYVKNNFQPTVRGIKIRGTFDTLEEAKVRAEVLKRMGDKFDIFVGQVGCWCPWSPNPDDLQDQVYAETQLNTMMKKYKENMDLKDVEFNTRRQAKINAAAVNAAQPTDKADTDTDAPSETTTTDESASPTNETISE